MVVEKDLNDAEKASQVVGTDERAVVLQEPSLLGWRRKILNFIKKNGWSTTPPVLLGQFTITKDSIELGNFHFHLRVH